MGGFKIRNVDDKLRRRLRLRAAVRKRSMAEEARQILRAALQEPAAPAQDLGARIRARFAGLGGIRLPALPREPVRQAPALDEVADSAASAGRKPSATARRRR